MATKDDVLRALSSVSDPELGRDIVSLKMVEDVKIDGGTVSFTLNLTTPACPLRARIEDGAKAVVQKLPGVEEVKMKTSATVAATRPYTDAELLKGVKNIIAVASGKGGVGKSTIAVNLAAALASSGAKVGILDGDIYGPNIPLMMGVKEAPAIKGEMIVPPVAHGVKLISLGFFYRDETPLIWRGPMVAGAIRQLLTQVEWGELDYLVIDLPPGCMPAGTLVLTANNAPKAIEKISVGDFVMSYDGRGLAPRRVVGVVPQGKQSVFKLRTSNQTVVASANHPFLKYHPGGRHYWRRLDQLRPGDRILAVGCVKGGMPFPLPRERSDSGSDGLPRATTEEFMRVVGHFVGDGSIERDARQRRPVGLRTCGQERCKFHEEYKSLYARVFGVTTLSDGLGSKLAVASSSAAELLVALGLDHDAMHKDVPDWVFSLPLGQRLAFIEGYAEATCHTGHRAAERAIPGASGALRLVNMVQDTVCVCSPNRTLVGRLHELCLMSGLRASNVRSKIRSGIRLPSGRAMPSSEQHEFDFSLERNDAAFETARIEEIEPAGETETFDLQVDEYENFVANGLVVHNTGDASLTLAQTVPLGGVVIVTTPQDAALNIATKALGMFKKLNVPILGIVENMSYFSCPHCGQKTHIFASGGGKKAATALGVDFLGEIPLGVKIREQSDLGGPIVSALPESKEAEVFKELAFRVAGMVSIVAYTKIPS